MVAWRHRRPGRHAGPRWRWRLFGIGGGGVVAAVVLAVGLGQVTQSRACAAVMAAAGAGGTSGQTATHYVLQGLPNCSYPDAPSDGLYVALPPSEYASAAACGGYLQVSGPDGSVRVKVIDQCPDCAAGHIDLSEAAFARLAPLSAGLISVTYTSVSDPPLPGPVSLEVKQGSSRYWLALLADNTGDPLASVQVQTASGWLSLARASYNYWIAPSGAGPGPFTVRLTDTHGHQATVPGIALSPGVTQPTQAWMYGGGGDPAPAVRSSSPPSSAATAVASAASPSAHRTTSPARPAAQAAARMTSGTPAPGTPATVRELAQPASPAPSARASC
jgi:expansin (peptidoglycan-binding protein)